MGADEVANRWGNGGASRTSGSSSILVTPILRPWSNAPKLEEQRQWRRIAKAALNGNAPVLVVKPTGEVWALLSMASSCSIVDISWRVEKTA